MLGSNRTLVTTNSKRPSFVMNRKGGAFPFNYGPIDVTRLTLLLLLFFFSPMAIPNLQAYTLTVSPTGSGSGTVNSSPAGITCPGDCTGDFSSVSLTANPDSDSIFSGWGGACSGMENCSLTLSADSEVTALFTAKSSTVQVGGSYYGALQKGCDDVAAGGTVEVVAQDQPGDLTLDRGIVLTLKGGYDPGFSSNSGNVTEVGGTVTLETGSLTVENIAVGQALSSTPTAAPGNIVATPGNGQVSLTWETVSGATSYNVYYSTSTGVTRATGTKETGTSSPSLTVTGLSNGTTYYFVVTAVGSNGESIESNQVILAPQATPAAPSNVVAVSGNSQATLSWDAVSGATSYNIYYSTSSSVSKTTGTKITGAVSPRAVTSLSNNTPYWFVVTAVNSGGESVESSPAAFAVPTAPATGFSQSDLTGSWYFLRFATGPDVTSGGEPGWMRGTATVAADGSVTINTYNDSLDGSTPPPAEYFDMTMTIDSTGVVIQSGDDALDPGNHAVMAANKQLVVGNGSNGTNRVIMLFVKQGVTTFSDSDLASKDFAFHQLESGDRYEWAYGYGSTNSSRHVTISSLITPSGPETPSVDTTLYFASPGIMRETYNTTSEGVMTPDKKNIFITESNSESACTFRVIQMTGGVTFSQSDLAGIWRSHALVSSPFDSYWEYQTLFIDTSGNAYSIVDTDSYGNTSYSDGIGSATLSSTGVMISDDPESDFHGQVSYNKDMVVITETWDTEEYSLSIVLEQ